MENCNELFLNEVVKVELVPVANCSLAVPFGVPGLTETAGTKAESGQTVDRIGAATMTIDINETDKATALLDSAPTLKTTQKTQAAGHLRQHDLTVPTRGDYKAIRQKANALEGVDFNVVLHTVAGTRFLLYAVPNSSVATVEDQLGSESKQTVKVTLLSMNHMIELT